MVRLPDVETQSGKYPMPEHAVSCEDYKQECFVRLKHYRGTCLMEVNEASDLQDFGGVIYQTEDVFLTRDQFNNIPEFSGF